MRYLLPLLFATCTSATFAADQDSTYRTTPGATILHEKFDQATLPSSWKIGKGAWVITDGAIDGKEKEEDMHGGVFSAKIEVPKTVVVTAEVRFEGANSTSMVFNGPNGHICRVSINAKGFSASAEMDKKIEGDKAVPFGKVEQAFTQGQWYAFTIEITGEEMLVYTDKKHVIYGKHAKVARDKSSFALTVAKSSIRFDNILIRAAEPNSDWDKRKAELGIQ